jgi:hypothetical protein
VIEERIMSPIAVRLAAGDVPKRDIVVVARGETPQTRDDAFVIEL